MVNAAQIRSKILISMLKIINPKNNTTNMNASGRRASPSPGVFLVFPLVFSPIIKSSQSDFIKSL